MIRDYVTGVSLGRVIGNIEG